jgi:hypothetical protein
MPTIIQQRQKFLGVNNFYIPTTVDIHGYIHGIHGFYEYEYEYRIFFMDNIHGYIRAPENLRI